MKYEKIVLSVHAGIAGAYERIMPGDYEAHIIAAQLADEPPTREHIRDIDHNRERVFLFHVCVEMTGVTGEHKAAPLRLDGDYLQSVGVAADTMHFDAVS